MLSVKNLSVRLGERTIVDNLSFSAEEGQWLMIAGPNGAGKSTVINAVTQGVRYTGQVLFDGEDVRRKKPAELARCMGVLMQHNAAAYSFSVEEVVEMGRYSHASVFPAAKSGEDARAVENALACTGMAERRKQSVLSLSGGELQRTFLAQVFAQDPRLLLLDEPTNHLDLIYQRQIFRLIGDWLKQPGRAVVSVVHDLSLAKAYGDRVLLMDRGKAVAQGRPDEVLTPELLDPVYRMDVYGWMREMYSRWI